VHAIELTLQPWKMVVVAQSDAIDPGLVSARAVDADAQFIVWRDDSELVVYDRERDVTERRPARTGPMDPVSAASAALTVKTMMRLPDPAPEEVASTKPTSAVVVVAPVGTDDTDVLRVQAGVGVDTEIALRAAIGAMARPTRHALRIGGALELARHGLEQGGFKGTAQDYSLLAMASWAFPIAELELEPWVAIGATLDLVDGKHGQEMREETAVLPTGRAGLALWWWSTPSWGFAVTAEASFFLGTPTYTRGPNQAVIYDMPAVAGTMALVAAWRR
jgi:hypothetical protein